MASDPFSRDAYAKKVLKEYEATRPAPTNPFDKEVKSGKLTDQKIGIIGAGMAGLYAGLILDSLGITNYEILEANPERVGGRVFTWYFDKTTSWNYVELGAMRFPRIEIMDRVIGDQPWSLVNYLNNAMKNKPIQLIPYYMDEPNKNNFLYYNSVQRREWAMKFPDPLNFGISKGGGVPDQDVAGPYMETLLDLAFKPFKDAFQKSFDEGWKKLCEYVDYSARAYLCKECDLSAPIVEYLECMDSGTGQYDHALTEAVMDNFDLDDSKQEVKWVCVEGGMSRLPEVMAQLIKEHLCKGKKVTKIAPSKSESESREDAVNVFVAGEEAPRTYDHVINTVPLGVLAMMDTTGCKFSYGKRTAVRALHVGSSVKIALQFKTRWWKTDKMPIQGGQSTTDLPIHTIVYPSYGDKKAPGVLLGSYTWGQDAARLGCLAGKNNAALVKLAISDIAAVHGVKQTFVESQYNNKFCIHDWNHDEYVGGPFALFGPG